MPLNFVHLPPQPHVYPAHPLLLLHLCRPVCLAMLGQLSLSWCEIVRPRFRENTPLRKYLLKINQTFIFFQWMVLFPSLFCLLEVGVPFGVRNRPRSHGRSMGNNQPRLKLLLVKSARSRRPFCVPREFQIWMALEEKRLNLSWLCQIKDLL